jgi:hypothetical protein
MTDGIRNRVVRNATPEEREQHGIIREEVEQELPELKAWARAAAARNRDRVAVGTVLTAEEAGVVEAIDRYAEQHALESRSAVVREALAQLLGVDIARR